MNAKITKLGIAPSRTVDLGPGNGFAKLQASVELEFDTPQAVDSKEVQEAFIEMRRIINEEFKLQYAPYKKAVKKPVKK